MCKSARRIQESAIVSDADTAVQDNENTEKDLQPALAKRLFICSAPLTGEVLDSREKDPALHVGKLSERSDGRALSAPVESHTASCRQGRPSTHHPARCTPASLPQLASRRCASKATAQNAGHDRARRLERDPMLALATHPPRKHKVRNGAHSEAAKVKRFDAHDHPSS